MTMGRGSHINKVPTAVENTLRRCFQQYKQVKIDLLEDTAMYGARFMPRPHSENTHCVILRSEMKVSRVSNHSLETPTTS